MGAWYQDQYMLAIFSTALSVFLSWPFAGVLGVGIAWDLLVSKKKLHLFITGGLISTITILLPIVVIDSYFYGRLVVAPLNIVLYNVFSEHGPDLYGTSPWTFYFLNGFLNFNVIFILALLALPIVLLARVLLIYRSPRIPHWLALSPLYLWILIFFTRPHKEERFLYPIYPLIGLAAALTWTSIQALWAKLKLPNKLMHWLTMGLVVLSSALSLSRIVGQYKGFHAPIDVFLELNRISLETENMTKEMKVCIGKEWHRFPSSFFLPDNSKLLYLPSEFRGQLPGTFSPPPSGTWTVPENMNDLNREEPSRYSLPTDCHYLIDLEVADESELEPHYSRFKNDWENIFQVDYMDASRSPKLLRSFYVPGLSETQCTWVPYVLLRRRSPTKEKNSV